ncbi:MAG TPA: hypothetical protein VMX58_11065, partial [Patescibacteria group bacterium]|nr:hypothetical protein [Patescibacteria group bacterium]
SAIPFFQFWRSPIQTGSLLGERRCPQHRDSGISTIINEMRREVKKSYRARTVLGAALIISLAERATDVAENVAKNLIDIATLSIVK